MPAHVTRTRRPRTVFHYKIDEDLKPEHRDEYLALIHNPRTRIDDAHAWLLARGYVLSRSAVARHRRRLLCTEVEQRAAVTRILAVARLAGSADSPDFAAGIEAYWKHLVLQRLIAAGSPFEPDEQSPDAPPPPPLTPTELLTLGKLVAQSIELTHRRLHQQPPPHSTAPSAAAPQNPPRSNEQLRKDMEDIIFGRK